MSNALVILSYNHAKLSTQCVDSVQQSLKVSAIDFDQLILCHNGSDIACVQSLQEQFPAWQHLVIAENAGYSGGVNASLKAAFKHHQWCFFLTNDTLNLQFPKKLPDRQGFYAPCLYRRKKERMDSLGGRYYFLKKKLKHCYQQAEFEKNSRFSFPYIPGTAFCLHRDVYYQVGEFDESLHTYWEDVDFSIRCLQQKQRLELIPDWQLIHKVGKTCHKKKFYTQYLFQRNAKIIHKRYFIYGITKIFSMNRKINLCSKFNC